MRHHAFGAVIGQRHAGAAIGHQLLGAAHAGGEGIDRHVHRGAEIVGGGVDIAPAQLALVGKADGVNVEIELAPRFFQRGEGGVEAVFVRDVTFVQFRHAQLRGQWLGPLAELVALIGERQFGPGIGQRAGDAPRNGFIVGEAHDQPAFALHELRHRVFPPAFDRLCQRPLGQARPVMQGRAARARFGRGSGVPVGNRVPSRARAPENAAYKL